MSMLLLTLENWFGPGRNAPPDISAKMHPEKSFVGMVTKMPLGDAIDRIYRYETVFKEWSLNTASEHKLVSVVTIDDLTDQQIDRAGLFWVEKLHQTVEEFS